MQLFLDLGKLFDKELQSTKTNRKAASSKASPNDASEKSSRKDIQDHLLIDDHFIGSLAKEQQIKLGAFLTKLMC